MNIKEFKLWNTNKEATIMEAYIPDRKKSDMAIIIFPGGAYGMLAEHEGAGYAKFFAENGYAAFVVSYHVAPHKFPLPLLDARRAVKFVRFHAEKFGIDKARIAVMGSSAGGHLAALTSTYFEPIDSENVNEIDREDFIPNYQILCYPVISLFGKGIAHIGSGKNLLGELLPDQCEDLSPQLLVSPKTPPAFIWHTFLDQAVNVKNSLLYAESLRDYDIPAEIHIFPDGWHGMGLATGEDRESRHVSAWAELLLKWLDYNEHA